MPEVIEVRQYRDFIHRKIKKSILQSIHILGGRYKKHQPFSKYASFRSKLPLRVKDVDSKGKFMYISFENNMFLGFTLGLTGGWFFRPTNSTDYIHGLDGKRYMKDSKYQSYQTRSLRHLNIEFRFSHGSLYFYDQLSFGTVSVFTSRAELDHKLNKLGIDMLDPSTTYSLFYEALSHTSEKPIGNALMNQTYISGIGNYLRADALWLAKVDPFTKVGDLTPTQCKRIYHALRILIWGQYDRKRGIKLGIIKKSDKFPIDYGRNFFVYQEEKDVYGKPVQKELLYEGSQKRYIFYVKSKK